MSGRGHLSSWILVPCVHTAFACAQARTHLYLERGWLRPKLALSKHTVRQLQGEWVTLEKDMIIWEQIRAGQDTGSIYLSVINDDVTLSLMNNSSQRLNEIHLKLIFDFPATSLSWTWYQSTLVALIFSKISQQFPRKRGKCSVDISHLACPCSVTAFLLGTYCGTINGLPGLGAHYYSLRIPFCVLVSGVKKAQTLERENFLYRTQPSGWRDVSAIMGVFCSSRGSKWESLHPKWVAHNHL